jgi:hypothetical protein
VKRIVLLVCAAALAPAGNAVAVPPDHTTDSFDYGGTSSCGSFDDVFVGDLDVRVVTTYDRAGNPVRDIVHLSGWETNYRSDMPSVSLTGHRSFTAIFDYASGAERDLGNVFTQTAPGQGVLFHDVGFIKFDGQDVTIHGPHDIFEQGDAAFCDALTAVTPS